MAALALALVAATSHAQSVPCAPSVQIHMGLSLRWGERIVETFDVDGVIVAAWENPETGTWTVTRTAGDVTCVTASGRFASEMVAAGIGA